MSEVAKKQAAAEMVADSITYDEILRPCPDPKPGKIDEALLCNAEVVLVVGF